MQFQRCTAIRVTLAVVLALAHHGVSATDVYGPALSSGKDARIIIAERPPAIPIPLHQAASIVADGYPAIAGAKAEHKALQSELRGTKWLSFPSLNVEALAITRGNSNSDQNGIAANVVLEQPIWAGGRIANSISRARANVEAGASAVREAQQIIALRTVQAYYELASSARREVILADGLEQHRLLVETIRRRVAQEVSPRSDLELALSRTAQIEQELAAAGGARMAAYSRILELVGDSPIDLGAVPAYDPFVIEISSTQAIEQALACSPVIERMGNERGRAEAERRMARSSLFPQLVGQLSHNEITGSRAGVTLRMQTGNGLSQLAAISSAEARIDGAAMQVATAERELREALRVDFVDNEAARSRAASGARAADSASLVTESYKRQFLAGRRTWLDVMNAVRESTTSRLSVADAEVAAMASAARILLRTCRWQPGVDPRPESEGQP